MTPDQGDQHPRPEPVRGGSAAAIRAALTLPGAAGGLPHWGGRRPRRAPATIIRPLAAPPRGADEARPKGAMVFGGPEERADRATADAPPAASPEGAPPPWPPRGLTGAFGGKQGGE